MATLTQIDGTQRIVMGWYGSCDDDDCASFPLETQAVADVIEQVYEIHEDSTKPNIFLSWLYENQPSLTQSLTSLRCGHSYYIELKKHTTGDDIKSILIPELVIADASTAQERYVTVDNQCGGGGGGVADISFLNNSPSDNDDLRISIGANLTEINSLCTSNVWAYRIEKLNGENDESGTQVQGLTFASGDQDSVTVLSNYLSSADGGDSWYKVYIRGYASDQATTVTNEVSAKVFIAWPKPVLTINGNTCADVDDPDQIDSVSSCSTKNISYLHYEGPSDSSVYSTAVGPATFAISKYLISELSFHPDSLQSRWEFSTNGGGTWLPLSSSVDISDIGSALRIRLKAKDSNGADMPIGNYSVDIGFSFKGMEDNPTTYYSFIQVNAEVKDRTIEITNLTDNRQTQLYLEFTKTNVENWRHNLKAPSGAFLFQDTDTVRTGNSATIAGMSEGPGIYTVEVWGISLIDGVWKTVTPVDSADVQMNWPDPTLDPTSTINEGYEEESGPSAGNDMLTIKHDWVTEYTLHMPDNGDGAWEIRRNGTDVWNTVPTSPTSYLTRNDQVTVTTDISDEYILRLKATLLAIGNNGYDRNLILNGTPKAVGISIAQQSILMQGQVSEKPPCCDGFPGGNTVQTKGNGVDVDPVTGGGGIEVWTLDFDDGGKLCFPSGMSGSTPTIYRVDLYDENDNKLEGWSSTMPYGQVAVMGAFTSGTSVVYEDPDGNCYLGNLTEPSPATMQLKDPGRNEGPTLFGVDDG